MHYNFLTVRDLDPSKEFKVLNFCIVFVNT